MREINELKQEILDTYPDIRSLPLLERIKARLFGWEAEIGTSVINDPKYGSYGVNAVVIDYKDKTYFKRFGNIKKERGKG